MRRQFERDPALSAVIEAMLLTLQQANYSALQVLDIAREIEKTALIRLADERLEEQLIRRDAIPKRGGHKAQGK